MSPRIQRSAYVLGICILLIASYFSYHTYYGRYNFMLAFRGAGNTEQHEGYLERALRHDPSYGYANQALARTLIREGKYGAALDYQQKGMESFRPIRSYEQLGSILMKLKRLSDAEIQFRKASGMKPRDLVALENLAILAVQSNNTAAVADLTASILKYDLNNLNAHYLRAKMAEANGQKAAAYASYQRIATARSRDKFAGLPPIFTKDEISERLTSLSKELNME